MRHEEMTDDQPTAQVAYYSGSKSATIKPGKLVICVPPAHTHQATLCSFHQPKIAEQQTNLSGTSLDSALDEWSESSMKKRFRFANTACNSASPFPDLLHVAY